MEGGELGGRSTERKGREHSVIIVSRVLLLLVTGYQGERGPV